MKAHINGVPVEGTPQEIWDMLQLQEGASYPKVQPMPDWSGPWWGIFPPVTCDATTTAVTWEGKQRDGIWRN